ncbi:hypothetical protein CBL_03257 [Carabus blaptoides fortunei]
MHPGVLIRKTFIFLGCQLNFNTGFPFHQILPLLLRVCSQVRKRVCVPTCTCGPAMRQNRRRHFGNDAGAQRIATHPYTHMQSWRKIGWEYRQYRTVVVGVVTA